MSDNDKTPSDTAAQREVIEAEVIESAPADQDQVLTETEAAAQAPSPAAAAPAPGRRVAHAALAVALVALLLAAGVAGLGHFRAQRVGQQLGALSPAIERNAGRIAAAETRGDALQAALEAQQAALQRQGRGLEEAIDALRAQIGRDQSGWVLAETEYLMLVANHRLQLERDVPTARAALQIADERLREIGDPALTGVREKLAAEIAALDTVARPDLTGLALRLMGLAEQIERLPLKGTYQPAAHTAATAAAQSEGPAWQRLTRAIWNDLKGLVTVRRNEEAVRPMLAPEQQYFLRQNLRLQIEAARLALLRADARQLGAALQTAQEWLGRYFDERSEVASGMQAALAEIAAVEIRPALPDISGSLNALRIHQRDAARQE